MQFRRILKLLDIFADKPNLRVDGYESYKTYTGVILTFGYALCLLLISVRQFYGYFDLRVPVTTGESFGRAEYPKVDLVNNKLLPVMIFYSDDTTPIEVADLTKYFTFSVNKIAWITSSSQGRIVISKEVKSLPIIACSALTPDQLSVYSYMKGIGYVYEKLQTYGMCPVPTNEYAVQGKGSDGLFELITMSIKPCSLSSGCKQLSDISKVRFQLLMPSSNINASDFKQPHSFTVSADDIYFIHPGAKQLYTAKAKDTRGEWLSSIG